METNNTTVCVSKLNGGLKTDTAQLSATPVAPVRFAFWQPGYANLPAMDCYHLLEAIPGGHGPGSTITSRTLAKLGYAIPQAELDKAHASRLAGEEA